MQNDNLDKSDEIPFEKYPFKGRKLLGIVSGDNCRHGYGRKFMLVTQQRRCAYCGLDLTVRYENWITMALDHVIPYSTCIKWKLPKEWCEDQSNRVLCCTACNTFGNRYEPREIPPPTSLDKFFDARDAIFLERKNIILQKHIEERDYFDSKPWLK